MTQIVFCAVMLSLVLYCVCDEGHPPSCPSEIYCYGPLLHTVQMAKIYKDSKTFVDMKMKHSPNETLTRFNELIAKNEKPSKSVVESFINENFEPAGQEFEDWIPADWVEHPTFVDQIQEEEFQKWVLKLNHVWKDLGRKMKKDVEVNHEQYSIIWVPNPVIVPGGRFREFYYWDSYWIVKGLLLSEMIDTVRGMLENFLYIVDNYNLIPNGGRIYYLKRSQPPLMIPMVKAYYDSTKDIEFIKKHIGSMEKEFNYWITEHNKTVTVNGVNYTLAAYGGKSRGPRPESYSEDVECAKETFRDNDKKESFYSELKAAAESGWDFSSRWFITNATNKGNLTHTKIRSILPVDLNAILYWNAALLSEFHGLLGNTENASYYHKVSQDWMEAVTAVLWHEEAGVWLDYDMLNSVKRDYFYPTNIAPLWTGCYNQSDKDRMIRLVLKYLQNKNILYPGGIPSTVEHTGEQWDYPNAWPPLQHIMVVGLNNTGDAKAQRLAFEIAEKWIRSNYKAFKENGAMFEKYDATVVGGHGGGGEYDTQLGFGWTNGIVMDFLHMFSDTLTVEDQPPPSAKPVYTAKVGYSGSSSSFSQISAVLIALMISLTAGFIGICIYKSRNSQQAKDPKKPHQRPSRSNYTELKNIPKRTTSAR